MLVVATFGILLVPSTKDILVASIVVAVIAGKEFRQYEEEAKAAATAEAEMTKGSGTTSQQRGGRRKDADDRRSSSTSRGVLEEGCNNTSIGTNTRLQQHLSSSSLVLPPLETSSWHIDFAAFRFCVFAVCLRHPFGIFLTTRTTTPLPWSMGRRSAVVGWRERTRDTDTVVGKITENSTRARSFRQASR